MRNQSHRRRHQRRVAVSRDPTFVGALHQIDPPTYRPKAEPGTFVYFVLDPALCQVKIGWTMDVGRRVRDIERLEGRHLELLGAIAGGYDLERALHARFEPWRANGTREWYSTEIVADVLRLIERR